MLAESQAIPAANSHRVFPEQPYGTWADDQGVTFSDGTVLTVVDSNPATGQYVPPDPFAVPSIGYYQFSAADQGRAVLLSYSYIPADIEQACIEIVTERYRYKDRVGQSSKSLAGQETVSFSLKSVQDYVGDMLQPYTNVLIL